MRISSSLLALLAVLLCSATPALAAPPAQERSHIIRFAANSYSPQPLAAGAGAVRYLEGPNDTVVAGAAAFRFRELTPNTTYVVVGLTDAGAGASNVASPVCDFVANNGGEGLCELQLLPGQQLPGRLELRRGSIDGMTLLRTF